MITDQQPPRPSLGMPVRFYPQANMDESRAEIGVVIAIGQSTVKLAMLGSRDVRATVRHKNDPRLKKSADQAQYGCWDFTEEWYDRMEMEEYQLATLASLDSDIRKLVATLELRDFYATPQSVANRVKAEEFGQLRRRAKELGVENLLCKTAKQLREAIDSHEERLIEAQLKLEADRKNRPKQDESMSEQEARQELLSRARSNPDAVRLAARLAVPEAVAMRGKSVDNPRAQPVAPTVPGDDSDL